MTAGMTKCTQCGANVSRRDQECSYCGTPNQDYQPPEDDVNSLLENGLRAFQQEQYALAITRYRQAIELDPDVFAAYFYLAASLDALGREQEAIEAMKQARRIRPGSAVTYYNLGLLYRRMGQKGKARSYFEEALKRVSDDAALENPEQMKRNIERELGKVKRRRFW